MATSFLRIGVCFTALFLTLFGPLVISGWTAARTLNLFIWSEYMDPEVVADFEKRHDCKVVIDLFEEETAMLSKLRNGGSSQYDVVVVPGHLIPKASKLQLLRPLSPVALAALPHLEPRFVHPPYDPKNTYSVPYLWGTICLYARPTPGKPLPQSWGLLFDPKLQNGPFLLIDGMRDLMGAALQYRGHSLNSTNLDELREARDLILNAKARSAGFEGAVGGRNRVLGKSVQAAIVFSGDGLRGMKEDRETVCFVPTEGSQIWVDNFTVCAQAPHPELAEEFIAFLHQPKIAAKLSNVLQYATPNRDARPFVDPEILKNPAVYPPDAVISRLEFLQDLGKATRYYDEIWTQIRAK